METNATVDGFPLDTVEHPASSDASFAINMLRQTAGCSCMHALHQYIPPWLGN